MTERLSREGGAVVLRMYNRISVVVSAALQATGLLCLCHVCIYFLKFCICYFSSDCEVPLSTGGVAP